MSILGTIFSKIIGEGVGGKVIDYFARKAEIRAQDRQQERAIKQALAERQIDLIKQGLTADMNWEMEFARQAQTSWKDEFTLLAAWFPAILCFIPESFGDWMGGAYYVQAGFESLQSTPTWYQLILISLTLATVGIRYWRRSQYDTEAGK